MIARAEQETKHIATDVSQCAKNRRAQKEVMKQSRGAQIQPQRLPSLISGLHPIALYLQWRTGCHHPFKFQLHFLPALSVPNFHLRAAALERQTGETPPLPKVHSTSTPEPFFFPTLHLHHQP